MCFAYGTGTLTFAAGVTSQTIVVPIVDDSLVEGDELFQVQLSNPVGATIADAWGDATIIDNEAPSFSVNDVTVEIGSATCR